MEHSGRFGLRFSKVLGLGLALALLLVMACGAAATSTPAVVERVVEKEVVKEVPKEVVVEKEVVKEVPKEVVVEKEVVREVVATPTPIPAPTAVPAAAVSQGKVVWMIGGMGSERFDASFQTGASNNYAMIMAGFLATRDEVGELLPGIATRWDLSRDGLTWTYRIREGVPFHDGQELTTEDAWWSLMHYFGADESGSAVDRSTSTAVQAMARNVVKVDQTGPDLVSITTKVADAGVPAFLSDAGATRAGTIMPRRPIVHDDAQEAAYDRDPIAAGPMRLTRHVPADRMVFERFGEYYYQPANGFSEDRRVRFTGLELLLVPEEATRVAALRAGEADIGPVTLGSKRQVEAGGGRLIMGAEGVYLRIMLLGCFRTEFPCHDKRVRQALAYAIDKEQMRDGLFGGPEVFEVKGWAAVTPSAMGYSPDLDPFPYDPEKAKQLLADAGYPDGRGFGKLVVNTWVSTSMPFLTESAQVAASFWRDVLGIDAEVVVGDEPTLKKQTLTEDLYGQILWRDNEARMDGASIVRSTHGQPDAKSRLHEDPELFAMVQDALAVVKPEEREAVFNSLYKRLRDEHFEMGIGYVNIPWAVGPKIVEWRPYSLAFFPSAIHTIVLK